ncbi:MAG: SAM hydrolase/SAM-dependent halogenase family protein [Thermoanaerobaculia bacterium]
MTYIALLTDFGTRDPYVAAMKGVIASRTDAPIVDLTHEVAPFDVFGAAWFLRAVVRYWPVGTIFVCVVDPGVGTARKIIAVEMNGKIFLAPDNGLLSLVGASRIHAVENSSLFLPDSSNTFHGRDRFAPVAAAVANGIALDELGPRIDDMVRLHYEPPTYGETVRGTIVSVDRFGNLITDIEATAIPFQPFALEARGITIDRLERTYAGAAPGAFLIVGSSGCIEISVANDSAAARLQMRRLEKVEVCRIGPR